MFLRMWHLSGSRPVVILRRSRKALDCYKGTVPNAKTASNRTTKSAEGIPGTPLLSAQCVITGASRGIGRATALRLGTLGACCHLVGRDENALQEVQNQLQAISKPYAVEGDSEEQLTHTYTVGNVTEEATWNDVLEKTHAIDFLVNAAGLTHRSLFRSTDLTVSQEVLSTNLWGPMVGTKMLLKRMIGGRRSSRYRTAEQRSACIINIASLLGVQGGRGSSVYAASKAGVIGFTRALSAELGPIGVRVNAILPGYIETEMLAGMNLKTREDLIKKIPVNRMGHVNEVAHAAVFLATNEYANNCILNLDGGLSATGP